VQTEIDAAIERLRTQPKALWARSTVTRGTFTGVQLEQHTLEARRDAAAWVVRVLDRCGETKGTGTGYTRAAAAIDALHTLAKLQRKAA
jgi:hypothetical protein